MRYSAQTSRRTTATMPRRVGVALTDILGRLRVGDEAPRLTFDGVREELRRLRTGAPYLAELEEFIPIDVYDLSVAEFRRTIASIRAHLLKHSGSETVRRYATVQNIIRTLTDRDTLVRMARMSPVPMPRGWPARDIVTSDQLVRSGHPHMPHWPVPVSSELYGSKLVSYFYVSGLEGPPPADEIASYLMAHDSDELVYFLGNADGSPSEDGMLPLYSEGDLNPYECVRDPIKVPVGHWALYDGNAPHYWFAPKDAVAFLVAASAAETYRKPVAFRWEHSDIVPGGSYPLFDVGRRHHRADDTFPEEATSPRVIADEKLLERTSYLLGRRLRRRRDGYGISAQEIERLKEKGRITANIIGKIENNALRKLSMRTASDLAEALDLPLLDLFPYDPLDLQAFGPVPDESQETLLAQPRRAKPFAIVPHVVRPQPITDQAVAFWEGEADVVLLQLSGAVDVYTAPDPLLLALDLALQDTRPRPNSKEPCFTLSPDAIQRLVRSQLLLHDRVDAKHAYHFNAALPHAVVGASKSAPVTLVVTTRPDLELPKRWIASSRPRISTD